MSREVEMSIKVESELRDRFFAAAAQRHRPASQVIQDLMQLYVASSGNPNALTAETLQRSLEGKDVHEAKDGDDLFRRLGI